MRSIIAIFVLACCGFPFGMGAEAEQVVFDFEDGPGSLFDIQNTADLWTVDCDGPNLRISKPEDPLIVNPNGFIMGGIRSRFRVDGDFSITVDYELSTFPRDPSNGSTMNESILAVEDGVPQVFEVLRFAHGSSDQRIEAYGPDAPIGAQDPPPEVLWTGRYRVSRVGETMTGAFAPLGSEVFTSLGSAGGYGGPVQVICIGAQGVGRVDRERANTALDIAFDNLIIDGLISYPPATYYVRADGSGDYPTIQDAVNAAADGDTVLLSDGTFSGDGNRDIDFLGKAIEVRSANRDPRFCVIDCQGSEIDPHRGFAFVTEEDSLAVVRRVTITNGYATGDWPDYLGGAILCLASSPSIINCILKSNEALHGGAIACRDSASPLIDSCRIINNFARDSGGGIVADHEAFPSVTMCDLSENVASGNGGALYCYSSEALLEDCRIDRNASVSLGGGVCGMQSSISMRRCVIGGNTCFGRGGGLSCENYSSSILEDCTFTDNFVEGKGGGIYFYCGSHVVTGCTFSGNLATDTGGGIRVHSDSYVEINNSIIAFSQDGGGLRPEVFAEVVLECCDIYGNYGGDWVGLIADQLGINGNFSADPCFCDAENGDYHLWNYSPCNQVGCGLIGAWAVGCSDPQVVEPEVPRQTLWASVSPNPVSGAAQIRYVLPAGTESAQLAICDPAGRIVRILSCGEQGSGTLIWDATDALGQRVAAGADFLRLSIGEDEVVKRVVVVP
ncbi:MAG: right-handed parallel beta-helix repeat-containing protein [Candidatus Eisenbacteria sp.]|nr:right-handed parallel beta-helix repeat-containing protein [Candidatus Eisenbacteria bacterium]